LETYNLLIDGRLVTGDMMMPVINPATGDTLAMCPRASAAQANAAIAAARSAFPSWAATPIAERRRTLIVLADAIGRNAEQLARLLTQEQGKPLAEASYEIGAAESFIRQLAELDLEPRQIKSGSHRRVQVIQRPLGVVAAIMTWNFPVLLLAFKLPAALLAGNCVVVKPASTTPLTSLRIGELCAEIFPPGVVNIISDADDLGPLLTQHADVAKVSFTGSVATGRRIMASAANALKRITLELGGNDAAIVLDDADVDKTAAGLYAGAFWNAGQVCIAIKRAYVHDSIYDAVCAQLAQLADAAVLGDGLSPGTQIGPLQNKAQFEKVKGFLADARQSGKVIAGGTILDRSGYFVRPTIVRDVADGCKIVDDEQFGPILPVIRYSDVDDAIERANRSPYGLGASIWSSDTERAWRLAARLESGTVWINKHPDLDPRIPFGGAKDSGIGVELGEEGLREFTQMQVMSMPN